MKKDIEDELGFILFEIGNAKEEEKASIEEFYEERVKEILNQLEVLNG